MKDIASGFLLLFILYMAAYSNYPHEALPLCMCAGGAFLIIGLLLGKEK